VIVQFNETLFADLIIQGYKFLVFSRVDNEIVIVPRKDPTPSDQLEFLNLVQMNIGDAKVLNIIQNLDLLEEFDIYFSINEDYFENIKS
jgi:hypothetical protein